jgi:hypothetical protein
MTLATKCQSGDPPEGYSFIGHPRTGRSECEPQYWNLDWELDDPNVVVWRLTPGGHGFDVRDLIADSLRLNGTVRPSTVAFEDSALILNFRGGEAVPGSVLTGLFSDSLRLGPRRSRS